MTETQQTINNVIAKMIAYSDGNKHDIAHFLKVYTYARMIGEMENLTERKQEILEIAAVIHDIASVSYTHLLPCLPGAHKYAAVHKLPEKVQNHPQAYPSSDEEKPEAELIIYLNP